jgi:hypothetical protein
MGTENGEAVTLLDALMLIYEMRTALEMQVSMNTELFGRLRELELRMNAQDANVENLFRHCDGRK